MVRDRVCHRHWSPSWSAVGELVVIVRDDGRRGEPRFKLVTHGGPGEGWQTD